MRYFMPFIALFVFTACLKEELKLPKRDFGGLQIGAAGIGEKYDQQTFFKLRTNEITKSNSKFIWDLAFENGEEGVHLLLNSSKKMYVYMTDETDLDNVLKSSSYENHKRLDVDSYNLDSTAFGDATDGFVRIIAPGVDANYSHFELYKLKITEVSEEKYVFMFGKLSSKEYTTVELYKSDQSEYGFLYYSLLSNKKLEVAPTNDQWDFVATQYETSLFDPGKESYVPYLVTGILINKFHQVKAIKLVDADFDKIDLAYAHTLVLSSDANTIGHDWKYLSGGISGAYEIDSHLSYIIQDGDGIYFKLRFIDFYDENGTKGTPTFEFQELGI